MSSNFSTQLDKYIFSLFVKLADFRVFNPFTELGCLAEKKRAGALCLSFEASVCTNKA
jgi:hypothetical protein